LIPDILALYFHLNLTGNTSSGQTNTTRPILANVPAIA